MNSAKHLLLFLSVAGSLILSGCDDDPAREDVPELITQVKLTFTPIAGGSAVVVTATDPDGNGPQDLVADGPIELMQSTTYDLSIELFNGLLDPTDDGYNLTAEIEEEADEHQFFFRFSTGVFSTPTGSGNIKDNPSTPVDDINYLDEDTNGRPLGLLTRWTTDNVEVSDKSFRIVLKHQPGIKSGTSTSLDGETDVDITFVLTVYLS
ncbi:MAG: hypothetical protein HRU69_04590 [Flammeovirgaceae bacterium]|nr:MAG: hypothetical protein HRU69_04590 [Flammeovirgaceae bacterium]